MRNDQQRQREHTYRKITKDANQISDNHRIIFVHPTFSGNHLYDRKSADHQERKNYTACNKEKIFQHPFG